MPLAVVAMATASLLFACRGLGSAQRDKIKDASKACDKRDATACFFAGSLAAEEGEASVPEAVKYWTKGCALASAESCDALATVKGPALRESALTGGCNAGDLVSCNRRAGLFSDDEGGDAQARELRQRVCATSATITEATSGRALRGAAEACASLARMVANGQGGGKDDVAAAKLEVLATTLRTEALFRHEHEQDGVPPPEPTPPEPVMAPGSRVRRGGPTDEQLLSRDRNHRVAAVSRGALDAWIGGVQASMATAEKSERHALLADPSMPTVDHVERAMSPKTSGVNASVNACRTCVEGCGSLERCAADYFAGGRCHQHKCAPGTSCPAFDACVAECTAKADACAKRCGDCDKGGR